MRHPQVSPDGGVNSDSIRNSAECGNVGDAPVASKTFTQDDCPFSFQKYCQPCDGEDTKTTYDCSLNPCPSATFTANTSLFETNTIFHHGCCEGSALRIYGKNQFGNEFKAFRENPYTSVTTGTAATAPLKNLNGIYELIYSSGRILIVNVSIM